MACVARAWRGSPEATPDQAASGRGRFRHIRSQAGEAQAPQPCPDPCDQCAVRCFGGLPGGLERGRAHMAEKRCARSHGTACRWPDRAAATSRASRRASIFRPACRRPACARTARPSAWRRARSPSRRDIRAPRLRARSLPWLRAARRRAHPRRAFSLPFGRTQALFLRSCTIATSAELRSTTPPAARTGAWSCRRTSSMRYAAARRDGQARMRAQRASCRRRPSRPRWSTPVRGREARSGIPGRVRDGGCGADPCRQSATSPRHSPNTRW